MCICRQRGRFWLAKGEPWSGHLSTRLSYNSNMAVYGRVSICTSCVLRQVLNSNVSGTDDALKKKTGWCFYSNWQWLVVSPFSFVIFTEIWLHSWFNRLAWECGNLGPSSLANKSRWHSLEIPPGVGRRRDSTLTSPKLPVTSTVILFIDFRGGCFNTPSDVTVSTGKSIGVRWENVGNSATDRCNLFNRRQQQ